MRYAVEQDSPDGGRSTYMGCWGNNACRGQVLSEHDDLARAVESASEHAYNGMPDSCTWIYDRRRSRIVTRKELRAIGAKFTTRYPGQ